MTSTAVVGGTGLVGSHILSTLLSLPSVNNVYVLARRAPKTTESKLHPLISTDSAQWASQFSAITPTPSIFFSGLGTTRSQAGGLENQRKIDYDLNFSLAQAAKTSGVKVYVLISSTSASASSSIPYSKMKGELEDAVKALGFEHTVLLRPGLIVGNREDSRPLEFAVRKLAAFAGALGSGLKDSWAQDADVIGKAAVSAGLKALKDRDVPKVWELGQADIVRLGYKTLFCHFLILGIDRVKTLTIAPPQWEILQQQYSLTSTYLNESAILNARDIEEQVSSAFTTIYWQQLLVTPLPVGAGAVATQAVDEEVLLLLELREFVVDNNDEGLLLELREFVVDNNDEGLLLELRAVVVDSNEDPLLGLSESVVDNNDEEELLLGA
ncbi:hypothetical protein B7494_g2323 [Chlorociboria aeruginascens]|nr:hypothetical protein B7494_g2323 [Chlorociboria aeruginascens]